MLFYRSSLPLSRQTLQYVTGVVGHRKQTRSKGRALSAGMQALMTLAYLKNGETFAQLGAGIGVGTATAWRYVDETVTLLPARSPKLSRALAKARKDGLLYLVLDGTLIPIDRVKADRPFYSGKHKKRGMNLQVIAAPDGTIVRVSGPLPGSVHDLKAARIRGLVRELAASGILVLADKGYRPARQDALQGQEQTRALQGRQPLPRQALRTGRTRQRPAQELEDPDEATLLPPPGRSLGQGHPRPPEPRAQRTLKRVRGVQSSGRPI